MLFYLQTSKQLKILRILSGILTTEWQKQERCKEICAPVLSLALGVQKCCYFTLAQEIQTDSAELWPPAPPLLFPVDRCLQDSSTSESGLFLLDFYLPVRPSVKVGQLLALLRTMLKWLIQTLAWVYFGPVQWDPVQQEHPHTTEIHQCTSTWEAAARNTGVSQHYSSNSHGAHVCDSAPLPPALLHHYISELTQETQSNRQLNMPSFYSQWSSTCSREARARAGAPVTGTRSHPPEQAGVVTWQPPAGRTWVCWSSL